MSQKIAELRWYFEQGRVSKERAPLAMADRFWRARETFSTPRCRELYRRWLTDGEAAFEVVSSPVIAGALERGTGRIESQVLLLSLSPSLSLGEPRRFDVEGR